MGIIVYYGWGVDDSNNRSRLGIGAVWDWEHFAASAYGRWVGFPSRYRAADNWAILAFAAAQDLAIGHNNRSTHHLSQHGATTPRCRVGGGCRLHLHRSNRTLQQRHRKRAGEAGRNMSA